SSDAQSLTTSSRPSRLAPIAWTGSVARRHKHPMPAFTFTSLGSKERGLVLRNGKVYRLADSAVPERGLKERAVRPRGSRSPTGLTASSYIGYTASERKGGYCRG